MRLYVSDHDTMKNEPWLHTYLVASITFLIIGLTVIAFTSLIALMKINFNIKDVEEVSRHIKDNIEDVSNKTISVMKCLPNEQEQINLADNITKAASKLDVSIRNSVVSKCILQSKQIAELESSVSDGGQIIVLTSMFQLDSGSFIDIIIDNIINGVTYKYLVPKEPSLQNQFDTLRKEKWWDRFWSKTVEYYKRLDVSDKKRKAIEKQLPKRLSKRYVDIIMKMVNNEQDEHIQNEARRYYCNHIHGYYINEEHTLVTIITYQTSRNPHDSWDMIMKLSTEMDDNEYYAFKIPKEERVEQRRLQQRLENFCDRDKLIPLELTDLDIPEN